MEMIGSGLFAEEAINCSPSNQDCKENIMLEKKENIMISYLPDKLKKQLLVESFIQLKVAVTPDDHLYPERDILRHMNLLICLLEGFELQRKLSDITLSSELWPSVFQPKHESAYELCQCLLSDICMPLIKCEGMEKSLLMSALSLCELCVVCSASTEQQIFIQLIVDLIQKETELLKRLLLVDCLSNTYSRADVLCSEVSDHILSGIKKIFSTDEDPIVGNLLMVLLPKISEKLSRTNSLPKEMWTVIESCFCIDSSLSRAFMLLCGLADIFFPVSGCQPFVVSLLQMSEFWSRLQLGFLHPDQLTRKRALFIFRRILDCTSRHSDVDCCEDFPLFEFRNQNKMQDIWSEFLLIIETLEEKQIHVIEPVLDRFDVLLQATVNDPNGVDLLHCSWILLLFRRMASHESAVIRRWCMGTLLKVNCSSFASDDKNLEFFCGPFIEMLSDSSLYYKSKDLEGTETSVELALPEFFRNLHSCLSENRRKWFWTSFFESLSVNFWNGGVLVYVARALAELPVCRVLGAQSVHHLRKLLSLTVLAHDAVFRSVIQCFFTKTFFNLVDLSEVGVDMLLVILGCLKMPETLCRDNSLWRFLVEWLRHADPVWLASDLLPKLDDSVVAWLQSSTDLSVQILHGKPLVTVMIAHINKPEEKFWFLLKGIIWLKQRHDCSSISTLGHHFIAEVKEDFTVIPDCLATVHFLLLTMDAGLHSTAERVAYNTKQPILYDRLSPVLDIVVSVNSRAYLAEVKVHQAFLMLLMLLKELEFQHDKSPDDEIYSTTTKLMSELAEDIFIFVVRKLMSVSKVCDYSPVRLYLALVASLARAAGHQIVMNSSSIQHLLNRCLTMLSDDRSKSCSLSTCVGLEVLGLISSLLPSATVSCDVCSRCQPVAMELKKLFEGRWTLKTQFNHSKEEEEAEDHSSIIRRVQSNLLSSQWLVLSWCFSQRMSIDVTMDVLDECVVMAEETLDVAAPESLVSCLKALTPLLTKLADDRSAAVLEMVWKRVKELMRKNSFWPVYDAFLELTFQKSLLIQYSPELETYKFLLKCFDDILSKSEEKSGMLNVLIHRICVQVSEDADGMLSLIGLMPCIAKALAFGPINDKAKRFHVEVEHFLNSLKDHFTEDDLKVRVVREDSLVRVELLSLLARLSPSCSVHQDFGEHLVRHLVTNLRKVLDSQHRNYGNCMAHRIKHRLLVALLVLEPFLKGDIASFAEFSLELISKESQPSVRFLGEWMFIRLIQFQPETVHLLWNVLEKSSETKKPTVVCSLLVIVVHVTELHLSRDRNQASVLQKALRTILLFCLSSNFNVRAFAQAALLRLWTKAKELIHQGLIDSSCCEVMEHVHSYLNRNKDSFWAAFQLLDSHYCFSFDPQQDFAIETLVYIIPCLSGMTDEEWLSVQSFLSIDPTWNESGVHSLPLYSQSDGLRQCISRSQKTKMTPDVSSDVGLAAAASSRSGNVQKKMVPWQSLLMALPGHDDPVDLELNLNDHSSRSSSQSTASLVLVTSLIDRIPNLGGLCRTCEVFGVSKFIIGSRRYLEDKTFETLSVTSHKWINIEEVLPSCLVKYLLEMKKAGYVVVGAEQSAKSQCLSKFQFPKKTLLLLGNERYGIPVEILQVLDVCVEVPQSGMIRSLNVHVTGALLIWEYYKQWNLAKGPSIPSTD